MTTAYPDSSRVHLIAYNTSVKTIALNHPFSGRLTTLKDKVLDQQLLQVVSDKLTEQDEFVVLLDARAALPEHWLTRLLSTLVAAPEVSICSALSTHIYELSPLAEEMQFVGTAQQLDQLLYHLQAQPAWYYSERINPVCVAIRLVGDTLDLSELLGSQAVSNAIVCDHLLVQTASRSKTIRASNLPKINDQERLPDHPLAALQYRLSNYLSDPQQRIDAWLGFDDKPVMLHICMNWEGGVQKWVNEFCAADSSAHHLILQSQGEYFRQRYGERYSLFYASTFGVELAAFDLAAPIASTTTEHLEYRQLLNDIIKHYAVGSVIVSTLIGHSMDCLRTGLPSIRVFHDYFPHWPALLARLDGETLSAEDRHKALQQSVDEPFGKIDEQQLKHWQQTLEELYQQPNVSLVAPDQSVVDNLIKISNHPICSSIKVIPHGIPKSPALEFKKNDNSPLTLLLPGRMGESKGQALFDACLQAFSSYQIVLLGSGKGQGRYAKYPNITVIEQYQAEDLGEFLKQYQPDIALILSLVSETFSYTLSEMFQAGIPSIVTAHGALKERVTDGKTGWVIADDAGQLIELVETLDKDRKRLSAVRKQLSVLQLTTPEEMTEAYAGLIENQSDQGADYRVFKPQRDLQRQFAQDVLMDARKIKHQKAQLDALEKTIEERTAWVQKMQAHEKDLANAIKHYKSDNQGLNQHLSSTRIRLAELSRFKNHLDERIKQLNIQIDQSSRQIDQQNTQLENQNLVINEMRSRNDQLRALSEQQRAQNEQLRSEKQQLNARIVEFQAVRQRKDAHLTRKEARIQELTQRSASLNAKVNEQKQELGIIYRGHSWRITAPLRNSRRWIGGLRHRVFFKLAQLNSYPPRIMRSLRVRGFKGTLGLISQKTKHRFIKVKSQALPVVELQETFEPLQLQTSEQALVSIIIPVYNQFLHTYNCLKSLAEHQARVGFEVIVIDDCSSDQTAESMQQISGVIYHRQQQNGGFIESCNQGAELAKGEYLLFLNNDTLVHDNWLDALLDVYESHHDAGLVGSKLVYPDNSLQEAGGIIFSDASGWNYGRGENPALPAFNFVRAVDYCSGASVIIKKALFDELGRFDTLYKPAYYEDTDLAFAVRNSGKTVYYQPASVITHFEGVTSGTDLSSGTKKYQLVNQQKFLQKWQDALTLQPASGTDIENSRLHGQPKRVLIYDACTPTPNQDSGSLRMINLIQILQNLGLHVSFMPENMAFVEFYTPALQQMGVQCLYHPHCKSPLDYFKDKGRYYDVVILSRYYIADPVMPMIREYCPNAQILFDTVDLHYLRERRLAEFENSKKLAEAAEKTRSKELGVAEKADITLVVSPFEQEFLATEIPNSRVEVLSNIHQVHGKRNPYSKRKDIMFVGGYQHPPNIDAVCWFAKDIFPLIRAELSNVQFHIIGSKATPEVEALAGNGIVFHGFVEDIEPFLDNCRIAVAPLRYGAGVKGKVNMSMSYGQPVVATLTAAEGMYTEHGFDVLMAESEQQFADSVIALYNDAKLWNKLSRNGLKNVEKWFSFQAAQDSIRNILGDLGENNE